MSAEKLTKIANVQDGINYLQTSPKIHGKIEEACTKMSSETGKASNELALAVKTTIPPSSASLHIVKSKNADRNLKPFLGTSLFEDIDLLKVVQPLI